MSVHIKSILFNKNLPIFWSDRTGPPPPELAEILLDFDRIFFLKIYWLATDHEGWKACGVGQESGSEVGLLYH